MTLTTSEAINIVRGNVPDLSSDETAAAWQHLVDNGTIWSMGPWHVQMAECLLASGVVKRNAA